MMTCPPRFTRRVAALLLTVLAGSALAEEAPAVAVAASQPPAATQPRTPSLLEQALHDESLKKLGVEPGSAKAQILDRWAKVLREDPDIARLPGGFPAVQAVLNDPAARLTFMKSGMVRTSAADRAGFFLLLKKLFDANAPADCFGITDMQVVMARSMQISTMSEADVDAYFSYLAKIVHEVAVNAPYDVPTPAQRTAAYTRLGLVLSTQITDKASAERFAAYSVDRTHASPTDTCWATSRSLQAIAETPDPERDVILRAMYAPPVPATQPAAPAPSRTPAQGAQPASLRKL